MRILAAIIIAAACACTGETQYSTSAYASTYASGYDSPELVPVAPGIDVVADYSAPVFYTAGAYWRWHDGAWYRSNNYARGWVYTAYPPPVILGIRNPWAYRYYRPYGYHVRHHHYYRPAPITPYYRPHGRTYYHWY